MPRASLMVRVLVLFGGLAHVCAGQEPAATCDACHKLQAEPLARSVHAALGCRDCHDGQASYRVSSEEVRRYAAALGAGSAQPHPASPTFDHGSGFAGKPARKDIPELCGACHANVERLNPYGLSTDSLAGYWTGGHGKTLCQSGDDRVAVCIDCHGAHDIVPGRGSRRGLLPSSRIHATQQPRHA